jgi:putative DNA primase/helicase
VPQLLSAAPTIDERVSRGREAGFPDMSGIVPLPESWSPEILMDTCVAAASRHFNSLFAQGYSLTNTYLYRDSAGTVIAVTVRLDHPTRRKKVLPLRASRVLGCNPHLELKAVDAPRPLYGLELLAQSPDAPVLIVEGEKAADAGRLILPEPVVISWHGGAQGVMSADLRPLVGRKVIIWPDNDDDGRGAALRLGNRLLDLGVASVDVVRVPQNFPLKWDIADHLPQVHSG